MLALTDNLVSPTDLHGFTRIFARAALVLAVRGGTFSWSTDHTELKRVFASRYALNKSVVEIRLRLQ